VYSTYVDEDERAAGGSTILVRDSILHSYVNLNTDLQAVGRIGESFSSVGILSADRPLEISAFLMATHP
jgi:hypothetical protein